MVAGGREHCSYKISKRGHGSASTLFIYLLQLLAGLPDGKYTLSEVTDELAKVYLCNKHLVYFEHAGDQWFDELKDKESADDILQRLQKFHGPVNCPKPEVSEEEAPYFESQEFRTYEFFEALYSVTPEVETRRVSFIWTVFHTIFYSKDCVAVAVFLLGCLLLLLTHLLLTT
jgi:hypothetical protein